MLCRGNYWRGVWLQGAGAMLDEAWSLGMKGMVRNRKDQDVHQRASKGDPNSQTDKGVLEVFEVGEVESVRPRRASTQRCWRCRREWKRRND